MSTRRALLRPWSVLACLGAVVGCDARSSDLGAQSAGQPNGGAGQSGAGSFAGGSAGAAGNAEPTSGAVAAPRGGSRLKARIAEAASGAFEFLGWQDTELDVACYFQLSVEGSLSCIPTGDDLSQVASAEVSLYGDARCSVPVRELQFGAAQCSLPRFAAQWLAEEDINRCQVDSSYFRVGEAVSQVYREVGGACERVAYPAPANSISQGFFAVEPMAIEEFVAGTLRDGVVAEGIQPRYVTTVDGAEAFWAFHDVAQGFDCQLATLAEGMRCVPVDMPLVTGSNFADENCEVPAAMALSCLQQDEVPYALDATFHSDPDQVWHIVEGGARLDTSYAGTATAGGCLAFDSDEGVFAIGDEVAGSSFASGTLEETAEQDLITTVEQAGGWSVSRGSLRNPDFEGYDCTFFPTSDGVVRCVPSPDFFPMPYADAACTEGLVDGWGDSPIVAFASEQCPRQVSVFTVGEEYSGPMYRKNGEQCVFDREQPPQPSRTIAHRLGDELPPESFPEISITLR